MVPCHGRELVQDTGLLTPFAASVSSRQGHKQFIARRHAHPPHRHPHCRTRVGSKSDEATTKQPGAFQARQCDQSSRLPRYTCGVHRQYTGSAGKITNCQIGVFAAYGSRHGHAFINRALYLPKTWTTDPARLAAAHVPEATAFATKPGLALAMIKRAMAAGVPFAWVAADSVYGVGEPPRVSRRLFGLDQAAKACTSVWA
jgi:hypothetical protein